MSMGFFMRASFPFPCYLWHDVGRVATVSVAIFRNNTWYGFGMFILDLASNFKTFS